MVCHIHACHIITKLNASKLFKGHSFSNALKVMLFISDVKYNVPSKLCKQSGSMHLFEIIGKLTSEHIKLIINNIFLETTKVT